MAAENYSSNPPALQPTTTQGAWVVQTGPGAWRLEIPAGPAGKYRVAQLDDYGSRPRARFPWRAPFHLRLRARASAQVIPGTWGFGLWNNPFGMAVLSGVEALRLPALPQTAWFFSASPPGFLSLYDDVPGQWWFAGTFRSAALWSRPLTAALLALGAPGLLARPVARGLRILARRLVAQSGAALAVDPTGWHSYALDWEADEAVFRVDERPVLRSALAPHPPLGLVIWVDNQYAAFTPEGRLGFGALANPAPAWIEVAGLQIGGRQNTAEA